MKQYPSFIFDSYAFDPAAGKVSLNYSLDDDLHFTETLLLPKSPPDPNGIVRAGESRSPNPESLNRSLHALHLIGGISYYKTCLPKKIEIRTQPLSQQQAEFWNNVYENGLGEFFFKNNIDFRDLICFPSTPLPPSSTGGGTERGGGKVLVPIGGGKDSIVTVELLREAGYDITLLRLGGHPLIDALAKELNLPLLTIKRSLPPLLFRLNEEGALNGHVPITAYLSFLALVVAELYGFDAVVMSNERSASEGNTTFLGKEINHQWSKNLTFEQMFRDYVQTQIGSGGEYFSLLRPWSELRIAQEFVKYPQYLPLTTSCNKNWKILPKSESRRPESVLWCGHCPKCAFVFALYAAFLPKETLIRTFGENLFDEPSLLPLYRELLGVERFKPFECVGTPDETKAAFLLARDRTEWSGSAAMTMFERDVLPTIKQPKRLIDAVLAPSDDHCIPERFTLRQ